MKRIEIIAPEGDVVNGTLVYNNVTRSKSVNVPEQNANKVVLQCGNEPLPPSANWSVDFDIVVLGGVFANGFTMNVVRDDDEVFTVNTTVNNIINGGHVRAMYAIDVINPFPNN